jgi:hypothetical protein
MNLTKTEKENIVRRIMADVPKIDYEKMLSDFVQGEALKLMPPEVRALYDNEETRCYLSCASLNLPGTNLGYAGPIFWRRGYNNPSTHYTTLHLTRRHWNDGADDLTKTLLNNVHAGVVEICRKAEEQFQAHRSMTEKLQTMLSPIRTLKQAKTLLEPELHKYLPAEPPKADAKAAQASTALVPYVVDNLRSLGWPKDKEAA